MPRAIPNGSEYYRISRLPKFLLISVRTRVVDWNLTEHPLSDYTLQVGVQKSRTKLRRTGASTNADCRKGMDDKCGEGGLPLRGPGVEVPEPLLYLIHTTPQRSRTALTPPLKRRGHDITGIPTQKDYVRTFLW